MLGFGSKSDNKTMLSTGHEHFSGVSLTGVIFPDELSPPVVLSSNSSATHLPFFRTAFCFSFGANGEAGGETGAVNTCKDVLEVVRVSDVRILLKNEFVLGGWFEDVSPRNFETNTMISSAPGT